MRNIGIKLIAAAFLWQAAFPCLNGYVQAQAAKDRYPAMAPLAEYLMPESAEIALAHSAAPASISADADVMVLRGDGYATAVKGTNGFVCIVERAWANATDDSGFWNQKMRAPNCFNPQAARTFLQIYLMKTKLVLAGKSKTDILNATTSALDLKELPPLEPGAMAYMMSKQQYLGDDAMNWHPHVMFFTAGDATKSWGADLPNSPVMAANDPEERVTILFVLADKWSDGTLAPVKAH
jgi:hypothetical protein